MAHCGIIRDRADRRGLRRPLLMLGLVFRFGVVGGVVVDDIVLLTGDVDLVVLSALGILEDAELAKAATRRKRGGQ